MSDVSDSEILQWGRLFWGNSSKKVVANKISNKWDNDRVLKVHGTTWILREHGACRVSREHCTTWVSRECGNGRVPGECVITSRVYGEQKNMESQKSCESVVLTQWGHSTTRRGAHVPLNVFEKLCVECKKKSLTTIPIYTIPKSIFSIQDCTLYFVLNLAFQPIPFESSNCSYFGFSLDVVAFCGKLDCFILIGLLCFIFCF